MNICAASRSSDGSPALITDPGKRLVTIGDGDYVIYDWNYLFSKVGLLQHDIQIATAVRFIGWLGMLCVAGWLIWRGLTDSTRSKQALTR